MKTVELRDATLSLADYAREAADGPLVVTVRGKPVAALVPVEGMDPESLSVSTNPQFVDLIEKSRRSLEEKGGVSSEEVRRRLRLPRKGHKRAKRAAS
jgi:prevent-host-death family protein